MPESKDEIDRILRDQAYSSIVALEPFVLGGCTYKLHDSFIELRLGGLAWSHQKMGTGRKILEILKTLASSMGFKQIVTFADSSARDFFLKSGF
jgi:N-acetylglutamate synthase-like GNAT family acetyltransferase